MSARLALIAVALAACRLPPEAAPHRITAAEIAAIPSAFPTTIRTPRDPAFQPLADALAAQDAVRAMGELVSVLIDLRRVTVPIAVEECGAPNASFLPREQRIRICYELLAQANGLGDKPADTWDDDTRYFVMFATLHEIAHALFDLIHAQPDDEEDRADQFALLMLTNHDDTALARAATHASAAFFAHLDRAEGAHDPADVHSASIVRATHAICMLWGRLHDPALRDRLGDRAAACQAETDEARAYWNQRLAPYTRVASGRTF
ncbi:MAG: DUF4344 domain-containing metallopeptidase [Deltaproteobacteria bacterium]|nr:DUF4344 domain-containing metallopeptidase [Deltaproteobacteria bacterium]